MFPLAPTVKVQADHSCNWRCCCCLCPAQSDAVKAPAIAREKSGSETVTVEKTKIVYHTHMRKEEAPR